MSKTFTDLSQLTKAILHEWYAGIRMPIAKTPSDYRANLNMSADRANRCF